MTAFFFRSIRHGKIAGPLNPDSVREIIRRHAQLSDQPLGRISAHSLRSGFFTEAAKHEIPLAEAMAMTGHRPVQTVMAYYRAGEVGKSRAADSWTPPPKA
jgi:integrase